MIEKKDCANSTKKMISHLNKIEYNQIERDSAEPIRGGNSHIITGNLVGRCSKIAIKVVYKKLDIVGSMKEQLDNEIQIVDALVGKTTHHSESPFLKYYGYHHDFIVMEYMANGDLLNFVYNHTFNRKKPYYYQIGFEFLKGMETLHSFKIIHRDIKPENILLNEDFHPKICDFGLSVFADENNEYTNGSLVGTKGYLAPELTDGRTYSFATDMYSAAQVIEFLFNHKDLSSVTINPDDTLTFDTIIPEGLSSIVKRGLNVNPKDRITASEAVDIAKKAWISFKEDPQDYIKYLQTQLIEAKTIRNTLSTKLNQIEDGVSNYYLIFSQERQRAEEKLNALETANNQLISENKMLANLVKELEIKNQKLQASLNQTEEQSSSHLKLF